MNRRLTIGHLERSAENGGVRRTLAARLDRALERAGTSSAQAAKWLSVSESDVRFWRAGITVPPLDALAHIATVLKLDIHWLCTGQTQVA
jgi:ribosome-binding protein aMBF1 (putative translation factor)